MNFKLIIAFCFSLLFISSLYCQEPLMTHFTENSGLVDANVFGCVQDKKGYMWFATGNGVSKFDGDEFINFTTKDGLSDNDVIGIYIDSKERIWFETFSGVPCYYFEGKIYNPENSQLLRQFKSGGYIMATHEDRNGNIWIGSSYWLHKLDFKNSICTSFETNSRSIWELGNELFYYSYGETDFYNVTKGRWVNLTFTFEGKAILPERVYKFKEDELILTFDHQLYTLHFSNGKFGPLSLVDFANDSRVTELSVEKNSIYANTLKGCYRINGKSLSVVDVFLPKIDVRNAFKDKEGNTWFCTNLGVFLLNGNNIQTIFNPDRTYQIISASDKGLLVSDSHAKVTIKEDSEKPIEIQLSDHGRIAYSHENNFFVGSNYALRQIKDGKVVSSINKLSTKGMAVRNDTLFCVNSNSMLVIPDYNANSFKFPINNLPESTNLLRLRIGRCYSIGNIKGRILIGMKTGIYEFISGRVKKRMDISPINGARITDIEFYQGQIYIGTYSSGIFKTDRDFSKLVHLADQLQVLKFLKQDDQLLAISKRNVFYVRSDTLVPISALLNTSVVINDATIHNGELYLATTRGVWKINNSMDVGISFHPTLSISLKGTTNTPLSISKNYDKNIIIDFNVISFSQMTKKIEYRLNKSEPWVETSEKRVHYSNLAPGVYTFLLRVKNNNGEVVEQLHRKFEILPRFWETLWFQLLCIILVFTCIFLIVRAIIHRGRRKLLAKYEVEVQLIEAEQRTLRAQMNPHFIFNSLNGIQNIIIQKDYSRAYKYLGKFSKLVRAILESSTLPVISIEKEIQLLKWYIDLEQLRFEREFNVEIIQTKPFLKHICIPTMIIQPVIENAIIHGLLPKDSHDNCTLKIYISPIDETHLEVKVEDNGVGRRFHDQKKETRKSMGIELLTQRLKYFDPSGKSGISLIDKIDSDGSSSGTIVKITSLIRT